VDTGDALRTGKLQYLEATPKNNLGLLSWYPLSVGPGSSNTFPPLSPLGEPAPTLIPG